MERASSSRVMSRSGLNAVPKSSSSACPAAARSVTEEMYEYAQWRLGHVAVRLGEPRRGEREERRRRERCEGEDVKEDSA